MIKFFPTIPNIGLDTLLVHRVWLVTASILLILSKWLTLAFLLESLMLVYIPANLISSVLGGDGIAPILTATLVGVPAYLNGYAALPLVSGLIEQGIRIHD